MYASNYLEETIINLMRGSAGSAFTAPAALYLAMFYRNPSDTGTAGTEASYSTYARQPIQFGAPTAVSGSSSLYMQNANVITFPEAIASGSSVQYVGVFDSSTGGNMLLYGPLTSSLAIQAGVSPVFRAGSLKWTWSGNLSSYYRMLIMNTLRGANPSISAFTPYIALYNGDPLTSGSELSGTDYARFPVNFSAAEQLDSGYAQTRNAGTSDNVSPIAGSNWGTLTHIAICDAQTAGNIFGGISLGTSYSMLTGSVAGFAPGGLTFNIA